MVSAMKAVTDPDLLAKLNASSGLQPVIDPAILEQLNAGAAPTDQTSQPATQAPVGVSAPVPDSVSPQSGDVGFLGRLGNDYAERGRQADEINLAANKGQIASNPVLNNLGAAVQLGGKVGMGAIADTGSEAFKSLIGLLPDAQVPDWLKKTGNKVVDAVPVPEGYEAGLTKLSQSALKKYAQFEKDSPNASRYLDAAANTLAVGANLTPGSLASYGAAAKGAGAVTKAAIKAPFQVAGKGVGAVVDASIIPALSEGVATTAALARKYNIPIGIDDVSDSKVYKTLISEGESVPFSGSAKHYEAQQQAFTKAVGKSVGIDDAKGLTPEVINEAFEKNASRWNELTKDKTFKVDLAAQDDLLDLGLSAEDGAFGPDGMKFYDKYTAQINSAIDANGDIDGNKLSKIRADLNRTGRTATDQNVKGLTRQLENTLVDFIGDDAPEEVRNLKYIHKNLIAIEPLAAKDQVNGLINPALLTSRVSQVYKRGFSRGNAGELGDLARIGQLIKQKVPNSGTAQRTAARNILGLNAAGSVSTAFVNPLAAFAQAGTSALGVVGNRALQAKNYNPKTIDKALRNYAKQTAEKVK